MAATWRSENSQLLRMPSCNVTIVAKDSSSPNTLCLRLPVPYEFAAAGLAGNLQMIYDEATWFRGFCSSQDSSVRELAFQLDDTLTALLMRLQLS